MNSQGILLIFGTAMAAPEKTVLFPPLSVYRKMTLLDLKDWGSVYMDWWQISAEHPGYQDCTVAHAP